jgi:hypothetical protein
MNKELPKLELAKALPCDAGEITAAREKAW